MNRFHPLGFSVETVAGHILLTDILTTKDHEAKRPALLEAKLRTSASAFAQLTHFMLQWGKVGAMSLQGVDLFDTFETENLRI